MITIKTTGLDQLKKNLKTLEQTREVSFAELFTPDFMRRNTSYSSFEEMLDASPFRVESMDDFEAIPEGEWDKYVQDGTSFGSWEEMQTAAAVEHARQIIHRGLG